MKLVWFFALAPPTRTFFSGPGGLVSLQLTNMRRRVYKEAELPQDLLELLALFSPIPGERMSKLGE